MEPILKMTEVLGYSKSVAPLQHPQSVREIENFVRESFKFQIEENDRVRLLASFKGSRKQTFLKKTIRSTPGSVRRPW